MQIKTEIKTYLKMLMTYSQSLCYLCNLITAWCKAVQPQSTQPIWHAYIYNTLQDLVAE